MIPSMTTSHAFHWPFDLAQRQLTPTFVPFERVGDMRPFALPGAVMPADRGARVGSPA